MKKKPVISILLLQLLLLFAPAKQLFANDKLEIRKDTLSAKDVYMAAMDRMMVKMEKAATKQSAEADFLQQMVPHHQGAIEMANYEIKHGKHFEMIQLAKSILAEQNIEVGMMNSWLQSASLLKITPSDSYTEAMKHTMDVMMDSMMTDASTKGDDYAFAQIMIPHHQAAIDMAKVILKYAADPEIKAFARQLISNEQIEIEQMCSFIK